MPLLHLLCPKKPNQIQRRHASTLSSRKCCQAGPEGPPQESFHKGNTHPPSCTRRRSGERVFKQKTKEEPAARSALERAIASSLPVRTLSCLFCISSPLPPLPPWSPFRFACARVALTHPLLPPAQGTRRRFLFETSWPLASPFRTPTGCTALYTLIITALSLFFLILGQICFPSSRDQAMLVN
ncbi:hypothetical protein EV356DRAFT_236107 [Viridothelium virens]|uniref:Uncharacterized protein n=1 Tax=Viridothelium virens TaxID=1048519 RepID=A0A6A6H457_VIRVR|nr:hypothetical protein EV356DRAFT_236107 [Viridothelium virens]